MELRNGDTHGGGSVVLTYPTEKEHGLMVVHKEEDQLLSPIHQKTNMDEWWYTRRRISSSHLSTRERTWMNGGTQGGGSLFLIDQSGEYKAAMAVYLK